MNITLFNMEVNTLFQGIPHFAQEGGGAHKKVLYSGRGYLRTKKERNIKDFDVPL